MCVYKNISCHLKVKGLQFGFVKDGGYGKCIYTVQNVVNHYVKRKSDVYVVTLDASAAFDRINVFALLSKLMDRKVPYDVIRVLLSWFGVSHACVRMDGCYTGYIDIRSGVKQGGIMSPHLYNVYVDDLMERLLNEKLGCMIGELSYGVIFYADDIVLMGASRRKVQRMVDICSEYGEMYGISFNPTKSKWFYTGVFDDCRDVTFALGGSVIERDRLGITYLGIKFVMKRKILVVDVNDKIRKFNSSAYSVLVNTKGLSEIVRCEIVVKKCLSVLIYGLGCSDVWPEDMYRLHVAYRKIFRHIFKLSLRASISELLNVFGIKSVQDVLEEKKCNILYRYSECNFPEIRFLTRCIIFDV